MEGSSYACSDDGGTKSIGTNEHDREKEPEPKLEGALVLHEVLVVGAIPPRCLLLRYRRNGARNEACSIDAPGPGPLQA